MRLSFSEQDESFRAELVEWLDDHPPPMAEERFDPPRSSADRRPWAVAWQRTLFDNGYLVPGWPPELGGRNANAAQQMIYFEEVTRREIRRTTNPQGLSIVTPSLIGQLNDGWRLSMGSLAHERSMLWINYAYDLGEVVDHLVALGKERELDAR